MADSGAPRLASAARAPAVALLASAFAVATCGLVYELLASTIASYLLGDSVTQFSTVIGSYLFAMGVGSWCSRYVRSDESIVRKSGDRFPATTMRQQTPRAASVSAPLELRLFVRVELLIALLGGFSAAGLFLLFPV